jgi:hypothetical protein
VFELSYVKSSLCEYDLNQFLSATSEEIKWLEDDHKLDLASLAACIIGFVLWSKNTAMTKLLTTV